MEQIVLPELVGLWSASTHGSQDQTEKTDGRTKMKMFGWEKKLGFSG